MDKMFLQQWRWPVWLPAGRMEGGNSRNVENSKDSTEHNVASDRRPHLPPKSVLLRLSAVHQNCTLGNQGKTVKLLISWSPTVNLMRDLVCISILHPSNEGSFPRAQVVTPSALWNPNHNRRVFNLVQIFVILPSAWYWIKFTIFLHKSNYSLEVHHQVMRK